MSTELYPLLLTPVYKDYLWGGRRIPERYGREVDLPVCAESWEIADRPEGMGIVRNGPLDGTSLGQLVERYGTALTGTAAPPGPFPLLIKIIDARQRLSVQVHPNDANAAVCGGEPKTEMWYVLDGAPGASVFAGLQPGTDAADLHNAIEREDLERLLVRAPAVPGDAIYIPGGTLHAIGEGCLLLEIQQNSNTTYRVYDWGRVGTDGKPRALHVEQAMQVIDWTQPPPAPVVPVEQKHHGRNTYWDIVRSDYFQVERQEIREPAVQAGDARSFTVLFLESGALSVACRGDETALTAGTSCLLPAALPAWELVPTQPSRVIQIRLGDGLHA